MRRVTAKGQTLGKDPNAIAEASIAHQSLTTCAGPAASTSAVIRRAHGSHRNHSENPLRPSSR
jgi:hypothetical protein